MEPGVVSISRASSSGLGRAMEDLLAIDAILFKVSGSVEESTFRNLERRLFQTLGRSWISRARRAVDAALKGLDSDEPATTGDSNRIISRLAESFKGWPADVRPAVAAVLEEAYRAGRTQLWQKARGDITRELEADSPHLVMKAEDDEPDLPSDLPLVTEPGKKPKKPKGPPKRRALELRPSFDTKDEKAMDALTKRQVFWVGRHYDENLAGRIAAVTNEMMLNRGLGRRQAGALLREALEKEFGIVPEGALEHVGISLPKGWKGTSAQYFEGLAANTVTAGRVHGSLRTLEEIGATRYEIVNPLDERTCPRCQFMDGKSLVTAHAIEKMGAELEAKQPESVKQVHPWAANVKEMEESKDLVKDGFGFPPFHFRCILPDNLVQGAITGGSKARYAGKAIELVTLEGRRLTVTPNHPVLTRDGFTAAGSLRQGDKLVCYRRKSGVSLLGSAAEGNEHQAPTRAEEVFDALAKASIAALVTTTPDDFHGDAAGFQGEVYVVGSYRELLCDAETPGAEDVGQLILEGPTSREAHVVGSGTTDATLQRLLSPPALRSGPGSAELPLHANRIGFDGRPLQTLRLGPASQLDAPLPEETGDSITGMADFIRELLERSARHVTLDELVEVREFNFVGHVYDFQTTMGWMVASGIYIHNCRCTVDIASDAEFVPTVVEPPGFPWKEDQLTVIPRDLDGAHQKIVYRAPDGSEWMFKPQEEFRALIDVTAARGAEALGLPTAEVHLVKLHGRTGSIQRFFPNVAGDLAGIAPEALTAEQVAAVQQEHAFDWLISQHDTHQNNVLRLADGSLRFIDKGQAFRFFGEDPLDLEFGKPGTPNPSGTYYHRMLQAYADGGDVKFNPKALNEFLAKVEALPDDEYVNLLRPYARAASEAARKNPSIARASWMGRMNEEEFLKSALTRKQNLRKSFEIFYEDLEETRTKALARLRAPGIPKERAKIWKERIADANESGFAGRSWFTAGADYENMNWLHYGADDDGSFMEAKLRPTADRRIMALIGQDTAAFKPIDDDVWNDTLSVAKSFNKHGGKVPDGSTADKLYDSTRVKLKALVGKGGVEGKMAQHYLGYLDSILDENGNWVPSQVGKQLQRWVPDPKDVPKPKAIPEGWKARKVSNADPILRKLEAGRIKVSDVASRGSGVPNQGDIYELTTPDGVKVFYQPHHKDTLFAAQGRMRIWLEEPITQLSPERADKVFQSLRDLGLETKDATTDDMELLYLRKVAFKQKLDGSMLAQVPEDIPVTDQIKALKHLMGKQGITFPEGYKFQPVWDTKKTSVGYPRWLGHHVPEDDREGLQLHHSLHGDIGEDLDKIFGGGTRRMMPTMEKIRAGIPIGGMSPETDVGTGGANYFFTRIRTTRTRDSGLYFKSDLLTDLDAITYDSDKFGRVTSDTISERHTSSSWKDLSSAKRSDETILKNGVGVDKWLERIVVDSEIQRQRVLEVLKKHNVERLGGKPIDKAVTVR